VATFALGSPALPIAAPPGLIGWYHLAMFGLVMPYAAIKSRARMKGLDRLPSLTSWLIRSLVLIAAAGALSLLVARTQEISLGRWTVPEPLQLVLGAVLLLAFVMVARPQWRKAVAERSPAVHFKMPRTGGERGLWIAVSVAAGVFEEITWRGVQVTLLTAWLGHPWLAALLSAVMFAVAHAIQNLRSIVFIFLFSLVMSVLVAITGSLILSMLIHAAYDGIAGFTYARFGRELGYQPPLPTGGEPAAESGS
jgi:membrane protease YdiL (CAAX protease family)